MPSLNLKHFYNAPFAYTPLLLSRTLSVASTLRSGRPSVVQLLTARRSQLQIPPLPRSPFFQTGAFDPFLLEAGAAQCCGHPRGGAERQTEGKGD